MNGIEAMKEADSMVFVVDDDVSIREALENLVRSVGLRVEVFASAEEFLRSKRPDVPGCLVLDVQLPGLSGLDLQNRMAEIAMEIPIIFITGHGDIPTSVRAMKAGAVAFLIKPFGDHDLIDAIQQGIERDRLTRRRLAKLTEANEALRGCLDALASVRELDDFLGQVMAAITQQLGAVSSLLRVRNFEQNTLPVELLFQNGQLMTPDEAKFPDCWRSLSVVEQRAACFLDQPTTVTRILDPHSPIPEALRFYLLGLGVKTLLIIPLTSGGQANGQLSLRFTEERDFHPEELEIARALAIPASLAIHLTRLAKAARQSAVLEERNQLAAEIHDALAQSFTGISMQLGVAEEQLAAKEGDLLRQIQRANEIAKFGLAEARRSILSLRSSAIEESGLTTTLQRLVEQSNVAGLLRCDFRSDDIPEERLPPRIQHELLRFAQEAISNAVRHAKPTVVSVTLRWDPPNLILKVKDNGSGISSASLEKSEGFGLSNMRTRASQIDGKLDIQTAAGHGTSIVLAVPIPS
jgi:two-component system, NarL family, sensor kinase